MYITKEEINKKFQNIFLKYDEVLNNFSNNRTENGFLSLNNLRLANSEAMITFLIIMVEIRITNFN